MSGRIDAIWHKRVSGGVMDPVEESVAVAGKGLEGDASFGRTRHVTVIEKEVFDRIRGTLPDAEPVMRRANVMVSGVRLEGSRDHVLSLGPVKIRIRGETRPCELMDRQCEGLREALDPHWGGGAHGLVVEGGVLRVGDEVSIEAPAVRREGEEGDIALANP